MGKLLDSNFVGRIALGTAQFGLDYGISNKGGQTSLLELKAVLEMASKSGIDCLDTAIGYGGSEENLGRAGIDSFKIVTKFPQMRASELRAALLGCMTRLKVDKLHGFIGHSFEALHQRPDVWEALRIFKEEGLVSKVGCSLYYPRELEILVASGAPLDLVQLPYNILDRRFAESFVGLCELGCEIHARSPFLQGLLLMPPQALENHFHPIKPFLRDLRSQIPVSELPAYLLTWSLQTQAISRVVFGVNDARQLQINLRSICQNEKHVPNLKLPSPGVEILVPSNWPRWLSSISPPQ